MTAQLQTLAQSNVGWGAKKQAVLLQQRWITVKVGGGGYT